MHVQGKNQEQVNSKLERPHSLEHMLDTCCEKVLNMGNVMSLSALSEAVMRIKAIISEDLLRASAASGGQQVPIMPPLTLYPQPPRPVLPAAVPQLPNATSVPAQGHRPAAPHTGVCRYVLRLN